MYWCPRIVLWTGLRLQPDASAETMELVVPELQGRQRPRIPHDMDHNADMIVVFGGTNDFGHGDAPMGSKEDKSVYTFYGAVQSLYTSIRTCYDNSQVVILTPLHRFRPEEDSMDPRLEEYVNVIRELALENRFHLLDLYNDSKIHPCLENARATLVPDGLHPNDEGHKILAEELLEFLRAI